MTTEEINLNKNKYNTEEWLRWIFTTLEDRNNLEHIQEALINNYKSYRSKTETFEYFYNLLRRVNIPETFINVLSSVIDILNFIQSEIEEIDLNFKNDLETYRSRLLYASTMMNLYPLIINEIFNEPIKRKVVDTASDIFLRLNIPRNEESENSKLMNISRRHFLTKVYAPVAFKSALNGNILNIDDFEELGTNLFLKLNEQSLNNESEISEIKEKLFSLNQSISDVMDINK